MSDIDIDSMDPGSARDYVLSFITTLKRTQKERAILQEELSLWERRVKLAADRYEPDLQKGAEEQVRKLKERILSLLEEEDGLKRKVSILKEKLKMIQSRASVSVDADALLAQLQMLTGVEDTLDKQLKEEEASQALEELKKRMENEDK